MLILILSRSLQTSIVNKLEDFKNVYYIPIYLFVIMLFN